MSYFRDKMTKIDFGWGSTLDPAGGAYSAPTGPLDGFKGKKGRKKGGEGNGGKKEGDLLLRRGGVEGKGKKFLPGAEAMDAPDHT